MIHDIDWAVKTLARLRPDEKYLVSLTSITESGGLDLTTDDLWAIAGRAGEWLSPDRRYPTESVRDGFIRWVEYLEEQEAGK